MLFEDGNRIDSTSRPKEHMKEWVDSEAGFKVLKDDKGLFESPSYPPTATGPFSAYRRRIAASCNEFWWVSACQKAIRRNQPRMCDRPYGICQQELQGLSLASGK